MKYSGLLLGLGAIVLPSFLLIQNEFDNGKPESLTSAKEINADCLALNGLAKVVCLANAFKASLESDQVKELQLTYTKASAVRWSNFPEFSARPRRVGVRMSSLNATQLAAAKTLMTTVLTQGISNEGYDELEGAMAADDYFGSVTGKTDVFTSGNFFMAFLGEPSTTALWELQFGGHHFAFANTYNGGDIKGATPSFRGVEPMSPFTQNNRSYHPMEQERKAFETMLTSLSGSEQTSAKLSSTFGDILLGPDRDGQFPTTKQGLRVGGLTAEKQKLVLDAIKLYVNDLNAATADLILSRYKKELNETYIAFSGNPDINNVKDYVRIDGPNVWIEYSAQPSRDFPGTVHPHSVWRDRTGDYGGN